MEILFFFFEFLIQLLVEALFHLGLDVRKNQKENRPILAFFGYIVLGFFAGLISLLIFPELLIKSTSLVYTNLIISPLLIGVIMSLLGRYKRSKGKLLIKMDTFLYGYIFALSFALVRFFFG